jgi:hypothetical protein
MKEDPMSWILNRYTITLGSIALLAAVWNIYAAFNSDGIITGLVVAPDHQPVSGATVVLSEKTLLVTIPRAQTHTNPDGTFRLTGHNLYHVYLEAYKEGVGRTPSKEFRLYFKGQNLSLKKPLILTDSR